jgi:hypothetical protein
MSSNTLGERERAVLEAIGEGRVDTGTIRAELGVAREELEELLSQLVENALVREDDGEYELTENGDRLLDATPTGERDDRIDTPEPVERAIKGFDLRPDEAAAIRSACSFLRYWGEATTAEIVDATYSEEPAGYGTAAEWWDDCVAQRLAVLPDVEPPANGAGEPDGRAVERWHYVGGAAVEEPDRDGREVRDTEERDAPFGSVRHGIEELDLSEAERAAARGAFTALSERGRATVDDLADAVYDEHPAGYDSVDAWTDWLCGTFEALPGVNRAGAVWTYDPGPGVEGE